MARLLGLCLLVALLACPIKHASGQEEKVAAAAERTLDEQIEQAIANQRRRYKNGTMTVESQIIEAAPKVALASGTADISTTGECEADIDELCEDVEPGEGRLADCIIKHMREEAKGNVQGVTVSDECRKEVRAFKREQSKNINKDVVLARACRSDVRKLCPNITVADPRAAIKCLKDKRSKLKKNCRQQVFRVMVEEASQLDANPEVAEACAEEVQLLCGAAEPQEGGVIDCLLSNMKKQMSRLNHASSRYSSSSSGSDGSSSSEGSSSEGESEEAAEPQRRLGRTCALHLRRLERVRGEDIRLDRGTLRRCSRDIRRFCEDVEYGEGRMWRCLEDHREESGFTVPCRRSIEAAIERESQDVDLNYGLRTACWMDVVQLCGNEKDSFKASKGDEDVMDLKILNCLETNRARLRSRACRLEVERQLRRESQDVRFDATLAQTCSEARQKFCADVQPGSARVIRCLLDHQRQLDGKCAAALFDHEVRMAEDIDFKYPLKQACLVEMDLFCKKVEHGHARVVRCLQQHLGDMEMSSECAAEVQRDQAASTGDYRLNAALAKACEGDIKERCKEEAKSGGGLVLSCLRDKLDELRGEQCKEEVTYFIRMEVSDYRNDVVLAEACKADVAKFCLGMDPGEGGVHACLRSHLEELSQDCRQQELKLAILQARDVRLRPKLQKTCSEELAVFCKDVKPGGGRVFRCLQDNMGKSEFGSDCREEVSQRIRQSQENWRLDYGVSSKCGADVQAHCRAEAGGAHARAVVLKCLVSKFAVVSEGCQSELSRSVRLALWDYSPGAALTGVCDADVVLSCPKPRMGQNSAFTIGVVGRCLSKLLAEGQPLQAGCRELVMVAAPKDAKAFLQPSLSVDALATKVAQMARSAGLSSTFVTPSGTGVSAITVSGWVALAAVWASVLVALVAAVVGVRRYLQWRGVGLPYRELKQGDV